MPEEKKRSGGLSDCRFINYPPRKKVQVGGKGGGKGEGEAKVKLHFRPDERGELLTFEHVT